MKKLIELDIANCFSFTTKYSVD